MYHLIVNLHFLIILFILIISLIVLSKSADLLVDNGVKLSKILGINEIVVGATIVSLGTALPELSTSVVSALNGNGGFAIGNAVGSIITNTSLILGTGALFGSIPVDKKSSQKLNILITVVLMFLLASLPYKIGHENGLVPRWIGFIYVLLIFIYIYYLIIQDKKSENKTKMKEKKQNYEIKKIIKIIGVILFSALFVAFSASSLVASAEVLAERIGIPDMIISATLVAFGTSVPELSTCISAVKNKHGGLAMGNILGANVLNILFVIGTSALLMPKGLSINGDFYTNHFVWMIIMLLTLGFFTYNRKIHEINKREGVILIVFYLIYLFTNILSSI